MKNWIDECNFRKLRDEDGVMRYYIIAEKQLVEVTKEVYEMYSRSVNHERYAEKYQERKGFLSLEKMTDDEMKLEYVCADVEDSGEDVYFAHLEKIERDDMLFALSEIVASLSDDDRELINAVIVDGVGVREYARQKGVYDRAIRKHRDRIFKQIKIFFEKLQKQGTQ